MVNCETNCCSHRAFPTLENSCLRDKLWKWFKCFASNLAGPNAEIFGFWHPRVSQNADG